MRKNLLKGGLSALLIGTVIGLSACDKAANTATETVKAASTEAEALAQFEKAKLAMKSASEQLKAMRTCTADNVLEDISSYAETDLPDSDLDQTEWFAQNAKRDGVVTTASGLQYKVNKSSQMKASHPAPTNVVRVHYHGMFRDGESFDSSYVRKESIQFPLNRVIKGWTEGVGLMKPCDAWTLYIPYELAYGAKGRPTQIPAKSPLIFHVQLIGISD